MFGRKRNAALQERLARLESELAALQARPEIADMGAALEGHTQWLSALAQGLTDVRTAHDAELRDLGRWVSATTHQVTTLSTTPVIPSPELQAAMPSARLLDDRVATARGLQVWTVMRWLDQAPVNSDMLISVVLPTHNRRRYLERAVASVLAQRHAALDLVIVNDGSRDDTEDWLATLRDPRIRVVHTTGIGTSAARNLGLDAVRGQVVTHLDDDNLMDPLWLRAVAWGFTRWPDTELLYAARIVEDGPARNREPSGAMPALEWTPYERARLEQSNYIDMNVIAHRAGLAEARFDPLLRSSIEWDMLLRLTARRAPLELPVIACLYSNYAPDRLSDRATYLDENRMVRARVHTTRPMRVLCFNALFPLMSETYIEEEMLALEAQGASIAFATHGQSVSPYPIRQPLYQDLVQGVIEHDPDVIVVYWASHALGALRQLEQAGRPFVLRVHSFDFDPDLIARIRSSPFCAGVWAFPQQVGALPGAHEMVPIFTTHDAMPPSAHRSVIASVSAGLPKKDWPLLMDVMDALSDCERVIVLARTNGFEDLPAEVTRMAANLANPPDVRINLPRRDVFALLARTAVLLYTVEPGVELGMPMSVIEGLYAGACVIVPDAPAMRAMCGEGYRPYRTAADIVAHVRSILADGPAIALERQSNHAYARARFCNSALGPRFHADLSAALTSWRMQRQLA